MKPQLLVLCNALDDRTRLERGIITDSPAASRKVFLLCQALKLTGVQPLVVSQGRGRAGGSRDFSPALIKRHSGVPVYYAPFSRMRVLSESISLLAPLGIMLRFRSCASETAVIFYNRTPAFLPALLVSSLLGYRNVLDLEDGEVDTMGAERRGLFSRSVRFAFDRLCNGGTLLACSALEAKTKAKPVLCYYGTAQGETFADRWQHESITVLMGGTLAPDTGADLLADAIRHLRNNPPTWAKHLHIEITGNGPSLALFEALVAEPGYPALRVHGRLTDREYKAVLQRTEVGLSLKPVQGSFANNTFPSKVIEFAASGLLVFATDISDVRSVLQDGALYLCEDSVPELIKRLEWVSTHRTEAMVTAERGKEYVYNRCAPAKAGRAVADFIFRRPA